jgi:hypothetical protein
MHKLDGYKCCLSVKIKEQCKKHRKRTSDNLFHLFFEKIAPNLFLVLAPYLLDFESNI